MKSTILCAALATLVCSAGAANAGVASMASSRVANNVACDRIETPLTGMLAYGRDHGTTKETALSKVQALPINDGSRQIAESRIEDVYLDPAIRMPTLIAYRTVRCQRDLVLRDFSQFNDIARSTLLQCQTLGEPGDRRFRNCIHDLLSTLEDKRNP